MGDSEWSRTRCFVRNEEVVFSSFEDGLVMMDVQQGKYYGLNRLGRVIWELAEGPVSIADLTREICARFEVSEDRCEQDVRNVLERMVAADLVSPASGTTGTTRA